MNIFHEMTISLFLLHYIYFNFFLFVFSSKCIISLLYIGLILNFQLQFGEKSLAFAHNFLSFHSPISYLCLVAHCFNPEGVVLVTMRKLTFFMSVFCLLFCDFFLLMYFVL